MCHRIFCDKTRPTKTCLRRHVLIDFKYVPEQAKMVKAYYSVIQSNALTNSVIMFVRGVNMMIKSDFDLQKVWKSQLSIIKKYHLFIEYSVELNG